MRTIFRLLLVPILMVVLASSVMAADYDTDAIVVYRAPPIMPEWVDASGYCCIRFDVDPDGRPVELSADYCTNDGLSDPSIEAIRQWTYDPAWRDGVPVTRPDVRTKMTFVLVDAQQGFPIPSATGFMAPKIDRTLIPPRPDDRSRQQDWQARYFDTEKVCGFQMS